MKNLFTLIASIFEEEETKAVRDKIYQKIGERLEFEDFFCEDIDAEVFLHPIHTSNEYGRIEENLRKKISEKILNDLKAVKGIEYEKILKTLKFYPNAANFLKYYKDNQ